jgi:hypothetical protein
MYQMKALHFRSNTNIVPSNTFLHWSDLHLKEGGGIFGPDIITGDIP